MVRGGPSDTVYSEQAARRRLTEELTTWTWEGGLIVRRYRTGGWRPSVMVANAIAHVAEVAFHHPEITMAHRGVTVRLFTHAAGGLTDKDFELARKVEEVVTWRPNRGISALEGVPEGPCFRYLEDK